MPLYNPPKIGQKIHVMHQHGRMFQNYTVAGETTRSWLLVPEGQEWITESLKKDPDHYRWAYCTKLAKAGQKKGDWRLGDDADVALNRWALAHRYKVKERIDWQSDEITLANAKLVGYTPLVEG
jgi:hypothetical protein